MKKLFLIINLIATLAFTGCNSKNEILSIKEINLELIKCPTGSFKKGSPDNEIGRGINETIQDINISKPFYIGKYEITQSQYSAIIGSNPSKYIDDNMPVQNVSFEDCKVFCEKLNQKYNEFIPKGYKFSLPTNEQWEYACRAGTKSAFNNGANLTSISLDCPNIDNIAWYCKNSNNSTQIVGQKEPNTWGIYDMHGNVSEWCINSKYIAYINSVDDLKNYNNIAIAKGGDFISQPAFCRSAFEHINSPRYKGWIIGFRVALVPVDQ